jgi:quercetin dioxygenase-like cupin family protein
MATPTPQRWIDVTADSPMALLERRRVVGEKVMISHVTLHQGCDVPIHSHENEQFTCVMSGRLEFTLGDERRKVMVNAGEVLHLPGNLPHGAYAPEETTVLDVFAPPSAGTGIDRR